jgi:hypothetical protein
MNISTRVSAVMLTIAIAGCGVQNAALPIHAALSDLSSVKSPASISGVVLEYGGQKPVANATVIIGTIPVLDPCNDCGHTQWARCISRIRM